MSTNNTEVYVPQHLAPGAIGGSCSIFLICLTFMRAQIYNTTHTYEFDYPLMSKKYADDYLRYSNNRSMFRSIWHLEQLGGRRTIKWDVNIVNDAENKICEFSLGLYYFQFCCWSPFRWLFPGVTREEKIVSMGPRCVSLSREGNFITYNFFISLREKIFSKLYLRTWWLMPNIFSSTCSRSAKFTILIQGMFLSTVSFLLPTLSVHITTGPFLWNGRKTQLLFDDHPVNLIFPHIVVLFIVFTKKSVQNVSKESHSALCIEVFKKK